VVHPLRAWPWQEQSAQIRRQQACGVKRAHDYSRYGVLITKESGESSELMGPMLVLKDCKFGSIKLMILPAKGAGEPWVARRCASWITSLGFNEVGLRIDSEPAIKALVEEIKRAGGDAAEMVIEHPEKGGSQSNGVVECAVGIAEGLAVTLKLALEARLGEQLGPTEKVAK
jgi:hypothetical protein